MANSIVDDYLFSLADLKENSKLLINLLTTLAKENIGCAKDVADAIIKHMNAVSSSLKLPCLYLIDSIIKNIGEPYISVFSENITIIFDSVFQKVDEATRAQMYKLRLTWNTIFPSKTLHALDIRIKRVDPAWPIAAKPFSRNVHVNPKFLKTANSADVILPATASKIACTTSCVQPMLTTGDSKSTASMSSKSATLNQLMFYGPNNQNLSDKNTVGPVENQSVPSLDLSLVHKQQDPRQKNLRQRDPRRAALQNYLMQQQHVTALSTLKAPSVLISKTSHSMPSVDSVIKVQPVVSEATVFPLVKEMVLETIKKIEKQHEETAVIGKNAAANFKSDKQIPSKAELPCILSEGKISCGRKKTEKGELNQAVSKLSTYSTKAAEEQKEVSPNKKKPPFHVLQNQKRPVCQYPRLPPQKTNKKIFTGPRSDCDLRLNKHNVEHGMVMVESSGKYGNSNADVDLRSHPKRKDNKCITGEEWDINGTDELYEPPEKKVKGNEQNADVEDSLFGSEDRDYRCKQLEEHLEKLNSKDSTAYKKAHLDELKPYPLHHTGKNVNTNHSTYKGYENLNGKAPIMPQRDTCSFNPVECKMLLRQSQQKMDGDGFKNLDSIQGCIRRNHSFSPSHESSLSHLHDSLNDSKRILEQACEINKPVQSPNQGGFTDVQHVFENISRPYAQLKMKEYGRDMPLHRDDLPDVAFPKQITSKLGNLPRGICTDYHHLSPKQMTNIQGPNIPVPTVRTIDLDGKPTEINFVDDKAFVLLGNNEPRQLMFVGNPVNVFIAELKLLLRFDGKPVQFELDDAVHSVKLGTPSRELYINDYPYEVKFGGPPITATLRNARVYDISLGGPPPHVEVSRQPVYELYQKYLDQNHRDPNLNPSVMARNDTDMRQIDQNNNVQNEQKLDVGQSFLKLELHSYFPLPSGFDGGKLSNRLDNTYIACHQEPQKWKVDCHPPPKVVSPITSRHSERGHPYQGTQMTNISHNTAPRGMPSHLRNWNQPMPPSSYTSEQNLEPVNHPWMSKNMTPDISESAQTSKLKTMFDGPREYAVRHFGEQGNLRNDSESLRQPNFRPPFKPALNSHTAKPEFSPSFATRPALFPPPMHPVSLPSCSQGLSSLERARHPVPPLVPQSSMHVNAFAPIKQEVPSIPVLPSTLPSESSCLPPLASSDDFQLNVVPIKPSTSSIVPPSPDLDVASLFSKLLGAGIICLNNSKEPEVKVKVESFKKGKIKEENQESAKRKNQESDKKKNHGSHKKENKKTHKKENKNCIPPIKLELESLKIKQPAVIDFLHQGTECVSCGMRFKEVDNVKYSRHLDWHFRMNRRGKNAISKAHSRMWYYEAELWAQFEEFEDPEECAQNFFELQANEHLQSKPVVDLPSVPISSQENESCAVCREPFQLFWMEDEEEWHLRNAVRHDDEAYHPLCHEDYLKAARERETQMEKSLVTDIAETTPMDVDMRADLYAENVKKEPLDEGDCIQMGEETSWLMNTPEETIVTKKEENRKMEISLKEELMQGKPGEEEVIGLISQSEAQITPNEKSERVVLGTGSIVIRVKPESLKLSSSSTESASEKEISEDDESEEEEIQLPTPDPRFQVLSPVQRGTEISSLCCIM